VITSVASLVRLAPLLRLASYSRPQLLVGASTFVLTLALAPRIEWAIISGVLLSVGVHLWRELRLEVTSWVEGTTLHVRPRGVLYFGTERRLEDSLLTLVAGNPTATALTVHLDGLGRIDLTGALALRGVLQDLRAGGIEVDIADVRPRWQPLVERIVQSPVDPLRS
jgi:sulfate permease, SulP family